jgi:subtilase family serine protease
VAENAFGNLEVPYDPFDVGENASGGIWGAGGGRSTIWAQPSWQTWVQSLNTGGAGRIVPDIGMQVGGCPSGISETPCPARTGYGVSYVLTVVGGKAIGLIGTSVASPEFVGAMALAVEAGGARLGNVNSFLWSQGQSQVDLGGVAAPLTSRFFRKSQPGSDGVFVHSGTVGFDYMYGNGSPDVRRLFGMTNYVGAGNPQTASNP